MIRVGWVIVMMWGLLPVCGCAPEANDTDKTPFELLDAYVSYLNPEEKDLWWTAVQRDGYQKTVHDLRDPRWLWFFLMNWQGVDTPMGRIPLEEHFEVYFKARWTIDALRHLAGNEGDGPPKVWR